MRVLVTGSSGYIGSALLRRLSADERFSLTTADLKADPPQNILDPDWRKSAEALQPQVIVNLAGVSGEKACRDDPEAVRVNAEGPHLLRLTWPEAVFIQASSASILGLPKDNKAAAMPYARSKQQAEQKLLSHAGKGPLYVLRFATVYGMNPDGTMRWDLPINRMCHNAAKTGKVTVVGPTRRRPWIPLSLLVSALADIVDSAAEGMADGWRYPIPMANSVSTMQDVANAIKDVADMIGMTTEVVEGEDDGDARDYTIPTVVGPALQPHLLFADLILGASK